MCCAALCWSRSEDMRAEFAAAAEARKRAGEDEEGAPSKRSKGEPLGDAVLEVLNQVRHITRACAFQLYTPCACASQLRGDTAMHMLSALCACWSLGAH
jgi:hypothetical protein